MWIIIAIIVCAIAVWVGFSMIKTNMEKLKTVEIKDVDLAKAKDGTYEGSCQVFPISVTVRVAVSGHRIEKIELLEHKSGQGSAADAITKKVEEAQSLQVDVISGATYSSQVIKKAIQVALQKA
jgi:uncharacterized protein with FMN-binding domain